MRMGGVSCCPAAAAAGDPTHALFADQATLFRIILWRCWATAAHEIPQPSQRGSAVRLLFAEPLDSSGCRQPVHRFHGSGIVHVLNIGDGRSGCLNILTPRFAKGENGAGLLW